MTRRELAGRLLAPVLGREQAHCIQGFAAWATTVSLTVFQRAALVLLDRLRAEFAGAMFARIHAATR